MGLWLSDNALTLALIEWDSKLHGRDLTLMERLADKRHISGLEASWERREAECGQWIHGALHIHVESSGGVGGNRMEAHGGLRHRGEGKDAPAFG